MLPFVPAQVDGEKPVAITVGTAITVIVIEELLEAVAQPEVTFLRK